MRSFLSPSPFWAFILSLFSTIQIGLAEIDAEAYKGFYLASGDQRISIRISLFEGKVKVRWFKDRSLQNTEFYVCPDTNFSNCPNEDGSESFLSFENGHVYLEKKDENKHWDFRPDPDFLRLGGGKSSESTTKTGQHGEDSSQRNEAPEDKTDLTQQFLSNVPRQKGGTCHIYSAVALAEAACWRYFKKKDSHGKHLDISEAYMTFLHFFEKEERADFPLRLERESDYLFNLGVDSGYPLDTLNRLTMGKWVSEEEFSTGFFENLKTSLEFSEAEISSYPLLTLIKRAAHKAFLVNQSIPEEEMAWFLSQKPSLPETQDLNILECQRNLQAPKFFELKGEDEKSRDFALQLLNRNIPFICAAPEPTRPRSFDWYNKGHAFVVFGHDYDENGRLRFLIRDSNKKNVYYFRGYPSGLAPFCKSITVLLTTDESIDDITQAIGVTAG